MDLSDQQQNLKNSQSPQKKVGLAISGGFIRATAAIGVIEVLQENNIPIDIISGCSSGAAVAAIYAAGTLGQLKKRLTEGTQREYRSIVFEPAIPRKGLLKGERGRKFFEEFVGEKEFRDLEKKLFIVTTDLISMKEMLITQGPVGKAIQAATAVPGIFVPVQMGGKIMVDGGNFNMIPSKALYQNGADYVIAVYVSKPPSVVTEFFSKLKMVKERKEAICQGKNSCQSSLNIFQLVWRAFLLSTAEIKNFYHQAYRYDVLIHPNIGKVKRYKFNAVNYCIEEGRRAALEALPQIKKDLRPMIDLAKIKRVYFIGIKGVAMSGLAVICKQRGMEVFGSDVEEKFITDKVLAKEDINVFEEFSVNNLDCQPELVVIGTSWSDDNIEVMETKKRKISYISDSEMRGLLSLEKRTIAVTGVHGKTTTTAMIAYLFSQAGLKPSFLIGTGNVPDLKSNAGWDNGQHFIVEGDEYGRSKSDKTPKFLDLNPAISVITSVEWEHVDVFSSLAEIESAFAKLVEKTKDLVVACADWPSVEKVTRDAGKKAVTYGLGEQNQWQAYDIRQEFDQTVFSVKTKGLDIKDFSIKLFGVHNVLNALAAIIVGIDEGLSPEVIKNILAKFSGTERRFDVSESNGVIFVDDYGHHPSEIKATLQAVRHRYAKNHICCVFQPHMASRTKALLNDFAQSFSDVDCVLFADIFASAREQAIDITSKDLAEETKKYHQNVVYAGDLNQTIDYLKDKVKPGMVLVTMGAGDVYRVRDKLVSL